MLVSCRDAITYKKLDENIKYFIYLLTCYTNLTCGTLITNGQTSAAPVSDATQHVTSLIY